MTEEGTCLPHCSSPPDKLSGRNRNEDENVGIVEEATNEVELGDENCDREDRLLDGILVIEEMLSVRNSSNQAPFHEISHFPLEARMSGKKVVQDGKTALHRECIADPRCAMEDCSVPETTSAEGPKAVARDTVRNVDNTKMPWENTLYKKQPYPDNFVPDTFLEKLVTNAYVREPDLGLYVVSTFVVIQQISAVALFWVVYLNMQDGLISMKSMVQLDLLSLFGGYATVLLISPSKKKRRRSTVAPASASGAIGDRAASQGNGRSLKGEVRIPRDEDPAASGGAAAELGGGNSETRTASSVTSTLGSIFLFLAVLRIMAPVLRTLTVSYSSDTIYALTVTCSFLHLAFHDYSDASTPSGRFQGTLSLNAAIFAAVLLASRLESNEKVFGFVLFALELFALFPLARREVKRCSLVLHGSVTSAMVIATALLLHLRHSALFTAYTGIVLLVTLACPLWLRKVHRHKLRIEGPWDIAHVECLQ